MADNVTMKNATGQTVTVRTTDTANVHTPHNNIDALVPGTGATNLGKAEDAAHASGHTGVVALAKRTDTRAVSSDTDGDYSTLNVDANGSLYVEASQNRTVISVTPTVSTTPVYSPGDVIGAKMSFASATRASAGSGVIENVIISDLSAQSLLGTLDIDLILFDSDPSNGTYTDNAACDIHDSDLPKIIAVINLSTWYSFADNSIGQQYPVGGLAFKLSTGTTLYGLLVNRSSQSPQTLPQFAGTSDLTVRLTLRRD